MRLLELVWDMGFVEEWGGLGGCRFLVGGSWSILVKLSVGSLIFNNNRQAIFQVIAILLCGPSYLMMLYQHIVDENPTPRSGGHYKQ